MTAPVRAIYAVGADTGDSSAWALVKVVPECLPRLVRLEEIFGGTDALWMGRAAQGCIAVIADAPKGVRCWIERPESTIKRSAPMAHHNAGVGLGMRIGDLRRLWYDSTGLQPTLVTPSVWWRPWTRWCRLRGKSEKGEERIAQAGALVAGAKERLASVPASRRVDCAESILIAGAACMAALIDSAEPVPPRFGIAR